MSTTTEVIVAIAAERKRRNLSQAVLAKQSRLRQAKLEDLEQWADGQTLTAADFRAITQLVVHLGLEIDLRNLEKQVYTPVMGQKPPTPRTKKTSFWFTNANLNNTFFGLVCAVVLTLVGFPVYVVARPAAVTWDRAEDSVILVVSTQGQVFTGSTARAKSMVFGGENVKLIDSKFELQLLKPSRPTTVRLVLTNYFNLVTEQVIIIR